MQNLKNNPLMPIFAVILLTMIWGYNWVVMKQSVQLIGPWEFAFIRNFFGALCLFFVLIFYKKSLKLAHPIYVFLIGLMQMIGFTVLVLAALVKGGTAKTSVLTFTMPIWANLLAFFFLKERIKLNQCFAIMISFLGLVFIFDPVHKSPDLFSMIMAISSGFFWGCGVVLVKHYHHINPKTDLLNLTAWQMLLGSIPIIFVIWFKGIDIYVVNTYLIGASIYNIIFCNAIAWMLWLYGVKYLKTSLVSSISLLAPVIGSIAAFIEFGEAPLLNELIGLILILSGIFVMLILASRPASK